MAIAGSKAQMKVLLVVSPNFSIKMLEEEIDNLAQGSSDFTRSVDWRPAAPLGILYIAGALRRAGHDVEIYDLHRAFYMCRGEGYLSQNGLSDFFRDYFDSILESNEIDVLGISCLFNVSSSTVEEMGLRCRLVSPSTKIVLGGHYPTSMYREVLKAGFCDYIVLGEAEEEFVWLLDHLGDQLVDEKISNNPNVVDLKGVDYPDRRAAIIGDLNGLAMPAWDLLPDAMDYITNSIDAERAGSSMEEKTVRAASIFTTRGCPMRCTFCAAHGVHGRRVRAHSIEYVMNNIDWLVNNYEINNLLIQDDMFNFTAERTIEFCEALVSKYGDRFDLEFPNGLAVWKLNEELIINLKRAGLKSITIAVESGSPYVQKHLLKKNLNLSLVKEKVELLKKHDIGVRAFYIVGFVGETMEMMQETVQFALDLDIDWSELKAFVPLAGSEMYDIAKEKGYLVGDTSEHVYGRGSIETPEFTPKQVEDVRYDANIRINFLNNSYLKRRKYANAEQTFRRLLKNFPNHLFAQHGLWRALDGQGKTDDSEEALNRLIGLSNESENNRLLLDKYQIKLPALHN